MILEISQEFLTFFEKKNIYIKHIYVDVFEK